MESRFDDLSTASPGSSVGPNGDSVLAISTSGCPCGVSISSLAKSRLTEMVL